MKRCSPSKRTSATALLPIVAWVGLASAQAPAAPTTAFKLGTFEHDGRAVIGIVLGDSMVVELVTANAVLERRNPTWVKLPMPQDMNGLAGRYGYDMRERIHAIVAVVSQSLADRARPAYVHDLATLRVLPPVQPQAILAAALNYPQHATEMTTGEPAKMSDSKALDDAPKSMPFFWERKAGDTRQNPYLFFKPPAIVVAHQEAIRVKPKRDQIDWECEFAVVVGRPASHVPVEKAREHIFGYSIMNDVGDRGGRGDNRYGSDWLVWKSSDTFAPLGPFIVPAELVPDPHKLRIWFTLSGKKMQDSNTSQMHHSVDELLSFVSYNMILKSGDVIATGTPGGVGYARVPPVFMKPGDVAACSVEGIGTLTNPIEAWEQKKPY